MAAKNPPRFYWVIVFQKEKDGPWFTSHSSYAYEETAEYALYRLQERLRGAEGITTGYVAAVDTTTLKGSFHGATFVAFGPIACLTFTTGLAEKKAADAAYNAVLKAVTIKDYENNTDPSAAMRKPEVSRV